MNWLRWVEVGEGDQTSQTFVRGLIRLRHTRPLLRQSRFLREAGEDGKGDVRWLRSDGQPIEDADWTQPITQSFAVQLSDETEQPTLLAES
jgi:glycogen operon protein